MQCNAGIPAFTLRARRARSLTTRTKNSWLSASRNFRALFAHFLTSKIETQKRALRTNTRHFVSTPKCGCTAWPTTYDDLLPANGRVLN
jgi:hypothetical protein